MRSFNGITRAMRAGALLVATFALSACFDFEQHLTLKSSGAGSLEVMVRMDPAFQDALEDQTILGEQATPVEVTRTVKDGQYIQEERVTFNALSELRLQGETLAITSRGATWFGLGPNDLTLTRTIDNVGGAADAFGLMRGIYQDRIYRYKATLPGWIGKAYPVGIAGEVFEAKTSGDTVTWEIPMAKALAADKLEFKIDFAAYMDIDGNVSATRTEGSLTLPR